jgi:hypothetical protein
MVNIPLYFEAGEDTGSVRFDPDGKVAGLSLRPAAPGTSSRPEPPR